MSNGSLLNGKRGSGGGGGHIDNIGMRESHRYSTNKP